jgi:hypothetical protein
MAILAVINNNFEFAILPIFILFSLLFFKFRSYLYNNITFINLDYECKLIILYIILSFSILQMHTFDVFYGIFEIFGDAAYTAGHRLGYSVNGMI